MGKIWPLIVGASRTFADRQSCRCDGGAAIDTPADPFDTYAIEWSRSSVRCDAILDDVYRYFYAPRLGTIVKYERDHGYGNHKLADLKAR